MEDKKTLKIVSIVILIIIIIFAIYVIRNYFILSKIIKMQAALAESNNFSYTVSRVNSDQEDTEIYYKDGKSIIIYEFNETPFIKWSDLNTKESILLNAAELEALVNKPDSSITRPHMPTLIAAESDSTLLRLGLSFISFISSDEIDNQKCYVVHLGKSTFYVNKENGALLKTVNDVISTDNSGSYNLIEYKNWTFNDLTDENVAKPNLTGFTVTSGE